MGDEDLKCCSYTQMECTPGSSSEDYCNQQCMDMCGDSGGKCTVNGNVQYCHCIC